MKRLAVGLLLAVAALLVAAKCHPQSTPWVWVGAFAEAAMVGALADWFAVVALFRRPMGLPIPHTAILPRNKARVADALASFVRDKFLGIDALLAKLPTIDPAKRFGTWLTQADNAAQVSEKLAGGGVEWLRGFDDAPVRDALMRMLREKLGTADLSGFVGKLLDMMTEDRRHQLLLDEGLQRTARWLDDPAVQAQFAERIMAVAGSEYPKMLAALGFIGIKSDELGMKLAVALVNNLNKWLHDIASDPEHERRKAFDQTVMSFIERLKTDAEFKTRIRTMQQRMLEDPAVRDYVDGLCDAIRTRLINGLKTVDSPLRAMLCTTLQGFGARISTNEAWRDGINRQMALAIRAMAPTVQTIIATHIAQTVSQWDDDAIAFEVESSVGSDLQFIRLNGTIVGGLVGLAIHAALQLMHLA